MLNGSIKYSTRRVVEDQMPITTGVQWCQGNISMMHFGEGDFSYIYFTVHQHALYLYSLNIQAYNGYQYPPLVGV